MTHYLIDTNVISELPKPRPNEKVLMWLEKQQQITLSAVTLEELTFGVERAKTKRDVLRGWLADLMRASPTIVDVTFRIAMTAGRLRALREAKGRRVAQADMLVAACALEAGLVLATRNVRDFEGCGLALVNPFE